MGCGLSQLSRSNRCRVFEVSLLKKPDESTYPASSPAFVSPLTPSSKTSQVSPLPLAAAQPQRVPPEIPPIRRIKKMSPVQTDLVKPSSLNEKVTLANFVNAQAPSADPSSCVSVKSFSDQDSGYKDDSLPEELTSDSDEEAGARPTFYTPDQDFAKAVCSNPPTATSHPPITTQGKSKSPSPPDSGGTQPPAGMNGQVSSPLPPTKTKHQVSGSSPSGVPLCSCGFSHAKLDGYVETYDDGYAESSHEELRSLAHEGSVFSIDILCHTTMDGSQKAHKVPLFVHKPAHKTIADRQATTNATDNSNNNNYYFNNNNAVDFAHRTADGTRKSWEQKDRSALFHRSSSLSTGSVGSASVRRRHMSAANKGIDRYRNSYGKMVRQLRNSIQDEVDDYEIRTLHD